MFNSKLSYCTLDSLSGTRAVKRVALPGTRFAFRGPSLEELQVGRPMMTQVSKMGPWFSARAVGSGFGKMIPKDLPTQK